MEISDALPKKIFVDLKFGPKWTYISTVRTFIENFMAISLENKKQAGHIAMAVNELIENAIKYSDEEGISISLQVMYDKNRIDVVVNNHASVEEEKNLKKIFTEINRHSPLEAYIMRMKESASNLQDRSSIGLARIRYESNAELDYKYEGGYVNMHAIIPTNAQES